MNKTFYILAVILLPILLSSSQSQVLSPEQIYKTAENSVLFVRSYDEDGYMLCFGSAVLVNDNGLVYTCFHVYSGSDKMEFELNGRKYTDAIIVGADPEKDIVIFKLKDFSLSGLKTGNSDSSFTGSLIYAIGNPRGYKNTFSSGLLSSIRPEETEGEGIRIQFSASISPGSSGGAVINSMGELIGIVTSSFEKGQNLNFAIPINYFLHTNIIDTGDTSQQKAMADLCRGYSYYKNNYYVLANELFNSTLDVFKGDTKALSFSGNNYTKRGLFDSALVRFNEIINNNLSDKRTYVERAWSYRYKDDTVSSLSDFNKALEIDSSYYEAIIGRAFLYHYVMHKYDSALADYNKALTLKPDNYFLNLYKGEAYLGLGDTDKAISELTASINYDYDYASTCYNRGLIFSNLEQHDYAIMDFSQAIKLEPENPDYYFSRGISHIKSQDYINAINDYEEGIKYNSYSATTFNNLAYCYLALNEYEDSEKNFKRSLMADGDHFDSYLGLSMLSIKQNERSDCIKYIKKAVEIEPLINKGMKGIKKLEKEGYFWSNEEMALLNKIFKLVGYYNYVNEDEFIRRASKSQCN